MKQLWNLNELFSVVWKYRNMSSEDVRFAAKELAERYSVDATDDLVGQLEYLKAIHASNLRDVALSPSDLLKSLHKLKLDVLFPNIIVILRIFCTLPVTVVQAERSFSTLARVKSCSDQQCVVKIG